MATTIYKVIYTKILTSKGEREGENDFTFSALYTDKRAALAQCDKYAEKMRFYDSPVSRQGNADFYVWIRQYGEREGRLIPEEMRPYESIEDGILKTPHLSVHHTYSSNR